MEVSAPCIVHVTERSQVGAARRAAAELARRQGFGESEAGRVAIAVSEVATNLVQHAGGGDVLLQGVWREGVGGIALVAIDRGPGLGSVAQALEDGFSTAGTPGTGLGAIRRQSQTFDLYSANGVGTAIFARFWTDGRDHVEDGLLVGGVCVPIAGEEVCGDLWDAAATDGRTVVMMADGLGHGPGAAEASACAGEVFRAHRADAPLPLLERMHEALRPTRGAAVAIADIDAAAGVVRYAGVGNIGASVLADGATRHMVSQHGTLGHDVRRFLEYQYAWPAGALLVLHSDGVASHWSLDRYPGLHGRDPTVVAGVLYRDFRRGRDDAAVLVAREAA